MEITCDSCNTRLNIPDHKIPRDRRTSFLCPKCSHRLHIHPSPPPVSTGKNDPAPFPASGAAGETSTTPDYDATEKPFDYLDDNARTALLCLGKAPVAEKTEKALGEIGYHILRVEDPRTALVRMKYHLFDMILIDEAFDRPHKGAAIVLQELKNMDMALRRQVVVVLISETHPSLDHMAAFMRSVNQVVNVSEILSNARSILEKILKDHQAFYKVFNESLKKAGKA